MGTDRGKMTRINAAKQALRTILGQLPESTQLGIRLLNGASGNQHWLVALGPIDRKSAIAKVDQIRADGGTPLGAAMKTAMDELLQIRKRQASGTYRLLVITDGEANDSRLLETYLPDMLSRGILIDVVGVDMKQDHSLSTRAHSYRRASDAKSFETALTEIFAESTATNDGNQDDFAIIEGLSDQFAQEALLALGASNNLPIGVRPREVQPSREEDVDVPFPSAATPPVASTSLPIEPTSSGSGVLTFLVSGLVCCLLPIVMVAFVVGVLMSKSKK